MHHQLEIRELIFIVQCSSNVVSHGSNGLNNMGFTIKGWDWYAFEVAVTRGAVTDRDSNGAPSAETEEGEKGLKGDEIGKGSNRIALPYTVT